MQKACHRTYPRVREKKCYCFWLAFKKFWACLNFEIFPKISNSYLSLSLPGQTTRARADGEKIQFPNIFASQIYRVMVVPQKPRQPTTTMWRGQIHTYIATRAPSSRKHGLRIFVAGIICVSVLLHMTSVKLRSPKNATQLCLFSLFSYFLCCYSSQWWARLARSQLWN